LAHWHCIDQRKDPGDIQTPASLFNPAILSDQDNAYVVGLCAERFADIPLQTFFSYTLGGDSGLR